jgi:hypothetical protein
MSNAIEKWMALMLPLAMGVLISLGAGTVAAAQKTTVGSVEEVVLLPWV